MSKNDKFIVIAGDIGSGFLKLSSNNGMQSFRSLVGETPKTDAFGLDTARKVKFMEKSFLVDKPAYQYLPQGGYINTLSKNWAASDGWLAMVYFAIDQACNQEGFKGTVYFGTGLPQAMFTELKGKVEDKLADIHKFEVGDAQYDVEIVPSVIPQAYASLLSITNEEIDVESPIGVIDIGTFTTGYSSLDAGAYIDHESDGNEIGMHSLYEKLSEHLSKEYGARIVKQERLESIMESGVYRHKGKNYPIKEFMESAVNEIVSKILSDAEELWETLDDREIVVAGGGSKWMFEAIKKQVTHAVSVNDPFFAVSMGLLAQAKAKSEQVMAG